MIYIKIYNLIRSRRGNFYKKQIQSNLQYLRTLLVIFATVLAMLYGAWGASSACEKLKLKAIALKIKR